MDETALVSQLNALLIALGIPIPLISPTDLIPRLLVAILESLMGVCIPGDVIERKDDSQLSKVQNMKVFLGVLETDILKMDVGLNQLDPRRLADGGRKEVVFVAELLCWIGRRRKLIQKSPAKISQLPPPPQGELSTSPMNIADSIQNSTLDSPSLTPIAQSACLSPKSQLDLDAAFVFQTSSTATWTTDPSTHRNISPFTSRLLDNESATSFNTDDHLLLQPPVQLSTEPLRRVSDDDTLTSLSDILSGLPSVHLQDQPHCIHQVSSPSFLPSTPPRASSATLRYTWCPEHLTDSCTCDISISPIQTPPIRYSGYIQPVDEESEIASFELSRSMSMSSRRSSPTDKPMPTVATFREQYPRTLELLNERARLLTHLAELKNANPYG